MEIDVDVMRTGIESAVVYAPFDEAKKILESRGYRIISLEENAKLRIRQGKSQDVSTIGNRVREGIISLPDKRIYLTKNSPIMENPKDATNAHRNGNEYFLTQDQVEQSLQDSVKLSGESIPTNRLEDNEVTAFAFGDMAEPYGAFLKDIGIKEIPFYLANVSASDKPFARHLWFGGLDYGLDYGSELGGDLRDLYLVDRLRGVKETGKGGSQKILYFEK